MPNTVTASVERLMGYVGKTTADMTSAGPALASTLMPTLQKMPGGAARVAGQIGTSAGIVTALKQVLTDHGIREADAIALEQMTVLEAGLMKVADPTFDLTPVQQTQSSNNIASSAASASAKAS